MRRLLWLMSGFTACGQTQGSAIDTATDTAQVVDVGLAADASPSGGDTADVAGGDSDGGNTAAIDVGPPPPKHLLGFVALLSGKFAVVDLEDMVLRAELGKGHSVTHGCGVMPGQQVAYIPNPDLKTYDRYEMQGDASQWKMVASYPAGLQMRRVDMSANGKLLVATPGGMAATPDAPPDLDTTHVTLFDTGSNKVTAKIALTSPNDAAVSATGDRVYVGNWVENYVSVIDTTLAEPKPIAQLKLPSKPGGGKYTGPSSVKLSHDGTRLLTADLIGRKFSVFDLAGDAVPVTTATKDIVHWAVFSGDDSRILVVTWGEMQMMGDEMHNTTLPSHLLVYDAKTLQLLKDVQWTASIAHVAAPPGQPNAFVSASFGTVLRYDGNFALTGALPVTVGQPMPVMTISY